MGFVLNTILQMRKLRLGEINNSPKFTQGLSSCSSDLGLTHTCSVKEGAQDWWEGVPLESCATQGRADVGGQEEGPSTCPQPLAISQLEVASV